MVLIDFRKEQVGSLAVAKQPIPNPAIHFGKRRRFWTPENRLITLRQIEDDIETSRKAEANRSQVGNGELIRLNKVKIAVEVEAEQAGGEPQQLESANQL